MRLVTSDATDPVPQLDMGVDVTKVEMSVEEGFVLSRIDGRSGVDDIAKLIGKDPSVTRVLLTRLAEKGVISFGDVKPRSQKPAPVTAEGGANYDGFIFPANLMMETNDLDQDERKRIIWTHEHLSTWNFYELLQVSHKVDAKAIKRAYFERSKEWHPDRFRRGNLGSFKKLIEQIYKKINEGYRVLSKAPSRKEYDSTIVFEYDAADLEKLLEGKRTEERKKKHEEQVAARRRKNNPVRKRILQAKKYYDEAVRLEADSRIMDALRVAQLALTYDPKKKLYVDTVERLRDLSSAHRIEKFMKRGRQLEATLIYDEAIEMFEHAVKIAPKSGAARVRLAYSMLMAGRNAEDAMQHAQRGVSMLGGDAEAHYVLGRIHEQLGSTDSAKRSYDKALQIKPNYQEAKKRLKRLKWGF